MTDFWDAHHFDFADALNEEIWRSSPALQQQIQPWETLIQSGAVGAQQAMLESELLAGRGPLPWVPDLVGREWQDESGVVIVGHAYAGFIREYSKRSKTMPLRQYLTASSVRDFQEIFLECVVRDDPSYYRPLQDLCSDLGDASQVCLMDLCRASFVRRGSGETKRSDDSSSSVPRECPTIFKKYVEDRRSAEWLWRRFASGRAKCVLALGTIAEHGLLRLFYQHGMSITRDGERRFVSRTKQGEWVKEYADPGRRLSDWRDRKTWWTIRGQVDRIERSWYVLPIYHPAARRGNRGENYERTKAVLKKMRAAIDC